MNEPDLPKIEASTLELVPEKVIRAYCVLPKGIHGDTITLYCPDDDQFGMEQEETIRFALNRTIACVRVPRSVLETEIDSYFPGSMPEISNCNIRFRFNCPKKWASLTPTRDPNQRSCSECNRIVYRCDNEYEAKWLGRQGKCVDLVTPEEEYFLGEVEDNY